MTHLFVWWWCSDLHCRCCKMKASQSWPMMHSRQWLSFDTSATLTLSIFWLDLLFVKDGVVLQMAWNPAGLIACSFTNIIVHVAMSSSLLPGRLAWHMWLHTVPAPKKISASNGYCASVQVCHVSVEPVVLSVAIECTAILAIPCWRAAINGSTDWAGLGAAVPEPCAVCQLVALGQPA